MWGTCIQSSALISNSKFMAGNDYTNVVTAWKLSVRYKTVFFRIYIRDRPNKCSYVGKPLLTG